MKKPTCTFSYGGSVLSFIPQGNEKNQHSILKYLHCECFVFHYGVLHNYLVSLLGVI